MSYTISVRALCEFTAKTGDLDLRFTPGPSAQDGIAGHAAVRSKRRAGYQSEVTLTGDYLDLRVRGRADGFDPTLKRVEEIKTYRGDLHRMPDNHRQLHWAQAKVYAYLLCEKLALPEINVALVYYEISDQTETVISEQHSVADLKQFFVTQCERFLTWAVQEMQHKLERDAALQTLEFPHGGFRTGQRELAEAVYRAAAQSCCLMAQAPTGIGKTIGSIFPLLKAMPSQQLDKLFYLAAKTSGRQLALDALALCKRAVPSLRVVELVAREKSCEHPDKACHGDSCPLAQVFYDRLPAARASISTVTMYDKATLREVALAHEVCPYYLSQEMTRWADVVVGDYNYYFDISAMLHGLTTNLQWDVALLIDEAHNMVERARKMYSAELDQYALKSLREEAPTELKNVLARLNGAWSALYRDQEAPYQTYADVPEEFLRILQKTCGAIADHMVAHAANPNAKLQNFYFDMLLFTHLAENFGEHSLFDITLTAARGRNSTRRMSQLCLRNIVPAPFLKARFASAHTTTLFSATLSPWQYYSDMLGLPEETPWLDVPSPFNAAQLDVRVVPQISTRYSERGASVEPIATLIAGQYEAQPGNYLAFFSSFDYLQDVIGVLRERFPQLPLWEQSRQMDEAAREQFLARFVEDGAGIGFAVLGGAFAEGIDLPGKRLIGAFVATLGLPQLNAVNEQIRQRMQTMFGAGYEYAYLYPGLQKVVQAAGRVIRTTSDQGSIFLIDDRYTRREVRALLPSWWEVRQYLS